MVTSVGSDPDIIGALAGTKGLLNDVYVPSWIEPIQNTKNAYVRQMKVIADRAGLPWNFYTYYGINTAYVLAQALDAAGPNLTRKGFVNALQTNSSFPVGGSCARCDSARPRTRALTGFYMGPVRRPGPRGAQDELHHGGHQFDVRQGQEGHVPASRSRPRSCCRNRRETKRDHEESKLSRRANGGSRCVRAGSGSRPGNGTRGECRRCLRTRPDLQWVR
jgi:hypothetical protein